MSDKSRALVSVVAVFLWSNSCAFVSGTLLYVDEPWDPGDVAVTEMARIPVALLWLGAAIVAVWLLTKLRSELH